jgi:hypothetical protein
MTGPHLLDDAPELSSADTTQQHGLEVGSGLFAYRFGSAADNRKGGGFLGIPLAQWTRPTSGNDQQNDRGGSLGRLASSPYQPFVTLPRRSPAMLARDRQSSGR